MKIYYDSTAVADGVENTELTGIKVYPVPLSMMDKIGSCSIVVKDFEGALYGVEGVSGWNILDFRKIKIEDDATNVIWRGYIETKNYEHNQMTLNCRSIAVLLEWKNFSENYILEEGLVKTVPLAGGDDSRLELKQNDQDNDYPDFEWTPDIWHADQDVGIIVYDTTNSDDLTAWTCQSIGQVGGVEISGNAASVNTQYDDDGYFCSDTATYNMTITPVIGGDNIPTTDAIKKITVHYRFSFKTASDSYAESYLIGCGRTLGKTLAHGTSNWVTVEGVEEITGSDALLNTYLTVDGANYDEIPMAIVGYSPVNVEVYLDYLYVEVEHNAIDYDQVMYKITDNDASWIDVAAIDWDDDTGVVADDAFKIGQNTNQILWNLESKTGLGITIQSTFTKYIARHFKGHNCLQILKTVCDLEGAHWWEDYEHDQIIVSFEDDFVASGVTLTDADYDFDWLYEDRGNNYSRIDVFGAASLNIHEAWEDPDVDSPKEFTIIDELIITNADALELAKEKFAEMSVKVPSIKITLDGVQSGITVGDTLSLALSRPTKAAATYPIRRIERAKKGPTGIKTIVYCGMGSSPTTETLGTIIRDNAYRSQKALTDRLISAPSSGIGGSTGVNWLDVSGRTTGVEAIITDELAPAQSIGLQLDSHQAAAIASSNATAAAALAAHHNGATDEHDGIYYNKTDINALKLNFWQPPDAAVPMNAKKITGLAKGTDEFDALTLQHNLIDSAYDPAVWTEAEVAPSRLSVKNVIVPLTNAVVYQGTWSPNATYTFTEDVGLEDDNIPFITTENTDTCEVVSAYEGKANVLHFEKNAGGNLRSTIGGAVTDGVITFKINNPIAQDYYIMMVDESAHGCCYVRYTSKTNIASYYGDGLGGAGSTTVNTTVIEDSWNKIKFDFDFATDTYSCWINDVNIFTDKPFVGNAVGVSCGRMEIYSADAFEGYIDDIFYSWESGTYPTPPADFEKGHWYLVDTDGYMAAEDNTPARWYEVGDWIVWNPNTEQWDHIRNVMGDNILKIAPGDSIQTAIDELEGIGLGGIKLLPGTHVINSHLSFGVINPNVHIDFSGFGDASILKTVGDINVTDVDNCGSITFKDFKIDCDSMTTAERRIFDTNSANDGKIIIENVTVVGDGTNGVVFHNNQKNVTVRNCNVSDVSRGVSNTEDDFTAYENTFFNCDLTAFYVANCNKIHIFDNKIDGDGEDTAHGIYLENIEYSQIRDNYVYDCATGIKLDAQSDRNSIISNTVVACSGSGIEVDIGDYNSITANVITGCGDGIWLLAGASNNYITVNQIENSTNEDIDDDSDGTNYILDKSTDLITVYPAIYGTGGATEGSGRVQLDAVGEAVTGWFYIGENIDITKGIFLTWTAYRMDANGDAITTVKYGEKFLCDGSTAGAVYVNAADTFTASDQFRMAAKHYSIDAADVVANTQYSAKLTMNEAAREILMYNLTVRYYKKNIQPT